MLHSAKGFEERCGFTIAGEEKRNQTYEKLPCIESLIDKLEQQKDNIAISDMVKVLDMLMYAEYSPDYIPNQLKNNRIRKQRRGLSNN